jgi:hypothetical protein
MNLLLVELKLLAFKDIPATKTTKDIRIYLPKNVAGLDTQKQDLDFVIPICPPTLARSRRNAGI